MGLLNINKKIGDQLHPTEINAIGKAIDDNTTKLGAIDNLLKNGYTFMGIVTPGDMPTNKDRAFYIALQEGKYVNFSNLQVLEGVSLLVDDGSKIWTKQELVVIANERGNNDKALASQKFVSEFMNSYATERILSEKEYDALPDKDQNTLYYIYEE